MGLFTMPSLGADMEAGTLVEWLVEPGDTVKRGDVVAVVETQKGAIEIECFEEGIVQALKADPGAELPVGAPLALIRAPGETSRDNDALPNDARQPALATATAVAPPAAGPSLQPRPAEASAVSPAGLRPGAQPASPAARLQARQMGLDLAAMTGSGPGGAVLLADVERHQTSRLAPATPKSRVEQMRKAIAAAMTRAKQTIPHFYLSQTIDLTPAADWLAARNARKPPAERLLLSALFVRAAVLAAAQVKSSNGHFTDGAFRPSPQINAGVAVALRGGGLVAPALIDAGAMSLDETMAGMSDLVARARAGRLRSSEMTEGTITVSSLGDTGGELMTGVIFPPQVALVGLGAPQVRPWVVEDAVLPRRTVTLTLSVDHRVSDGRQASRFITLFETLITKPETL